MNAASIAKTLKAKGQAMTLTRVSGGTYDPVAGSVSAPATQTWTVYGIETAFRDGLTMSAGTLIQSGDRLAIVAADQATPIPGDSLTIGGVAWKIIAVTPVNPAGTALLFKCQVRK
jgi:hypothetical protein